MIVITYGNLRMISFLDETVSFFVAIKFICILVTVRSSKIINSCIILDSEVLEIIAIFSKKNNPKKKNYLFDYN